MGIASSFLPFIAYAVLAQVLPLAAALVAAATVAVIMVLRERFIRRRRIKILEAGTALLFAALALLVAGTGASWSLGEVRLAVDGGLMAIVLASLLAGRPFTLQYAAEQVSPEIAARPAFRRANTVISSIWLAAFGVMTLADYLMARVATIPQWVDVAAIAGAFVVAVWFTRWYPARLRRRAA